MLEKPNTRHQRVFDRWPFQNICNRALEAWNASIPACSTPLKSTCQPMQGDFLVLLASSCIVALIMFGYQVISMSMSNETCLAKGRLLVFVAVRSWDKPSCIQHRQPACTPKRRNSYHHNALLQPWLVWFGINLHVLFSTFHAHYSHSIKLGRWDQRGYFPCIGCRRLDWMAACLNRSTLRSIRGYGGPQESLCYGPIFLE